MALPLAFHPRKSVLPGCMPRESSDHGDVVVAGQFHSHPGVVILERAQHYAVAARIFDGPRWHVGTGSHASALHIRRLRVSLPRPGFGDQVWHVPSRDETLHPPTAAQHGSIATCLKSARTANAATETSPPPTRRTSALSSAPGARTAWNASKIGPAPTAAATFNGVLSGRQRHGSTTRRAPSGSSPPVAGSSSPASRWTPRQLARFVQPEKILRKRPVCGVTGTTLAKPSRPSGDCSRALRPESGPVPLC